MRLFLIFLAWVVGIGIPSASLGLDPQQESKIRLLLHYAHLRTCVQVFGRRGAGNGWAQMNMLTTLNPDHIVHVFEQRAGLLGLSLDQYLMPFSKKERAFLESLVHLNSHGAATMSIPVNLDLAIYDPFHETLSHLFSSLPIGGGPRFIQVFGAGEEVVELGAIIQLVKIQARRQGLTPESFCQKYDLRFAFRDVSPMVLNKIEILIGDALNENPWLQNRTEVRFINLTLPPLYQDIASSSTILTFCRNVFRHKITTQGRTVLDQFSRIAVKGGLLVVDGGGGKSLLESADHSLQHLFDVEAAARWSSHSLDFEPDLVFSVWRNPF